MDSNEELSEDEKDLDQINSLYDENPLIEEKLLNIEYLKQDNIMNEEFF